MKVSRAFSLGKVQAELDFVDVTPQRDTKVFVDPYALEIKQDTWSLSCADHIRSFFQEILSALRKNDNPRLAYLTAHWGEAQETYLGVSKGKPKGKGIGLKQSKQILAALKGSRAVQTGVLSDLAEAELFIAGIGRDKISDMTTNIIRGPLIEYTKAQCELHRIPLKVSQTVGPVWDPSATMWKQDYRELPVISGKPIILVPKYSVRRKLSLDSQEFYNFHMVEFLQDEYLSANSSLVHVLKSGERRVYKEDVKERHPKVKNHIAEFVRENPHVLEEYKRIKGAGGTLENEDFDESFDERTFAVALINALAEISPGNAAASAYHSLLVGLLSFIFFPGLIYPIKEREIHSGRKRIDIRFTNSGQGDFFDKILKSPQTRALTVPVECKNYSQEIANPELDQIAGRFSHTRGFFGLVCCRKLDKRNLFLERCKDTAKDGRGYVIFFEDEDLQKILEQISQGNRGFVIGYMNERFNELLD